MTARRASAIALLAILVFDVWWRGHTIAGTVRSAIGFAPWPVVAEAEPLDCDEAIYGYIGKRLAAGDVMYRDLTENKPPLGYWLFGLAAALGGANETSIRLMPVPMVLATIALAWRIAGRLGGPFAAAMAAMIYALMSTDPYLYGNGANMEHAVNLFGAASLAAMVLGWNGNARWPIFAAGAMVGAASLVKQVAVAPLAIYVIGLMIRAEGRSWASRVVDVAALLGGFLASWAAAVGVLVLQGAGWQAYDDIIRYGGALATDTPRDPKEYPSAVRWFVGNTDPNGLLPWPFGLTKGRAWWAAGSWPLWAAMVPSLGWMALGRSGGARRLVAGWTVAAWAAVVAPRLFWQHYYLVPLPGVAVLVAVSSADALAACRRGRRPLAGLAFVLLLGSAGATAIIQGRWYLHVPPNTLTTDDKGGGQWVALREIGRELGRRTRGWGPSHLFVWGIQSPLFLYSGLDGVTPQLFTDPLMVAFAQSDHPLIRPRIERTLRDLDARRPELVFVGEAPFPALLNFLRAHYRPSPLTVRGRVIPGLAGRLWVRADRFDEFEKAAL